MKNERQLLKEIIRSNSRHQARSKAICESDLREYGQSYVEPAGNVIGVIGADIDGDHRYYQELTVTHDSSTDEITIVVKDQGAAGGMDGPGGTTGFMLSGKTVLPAGAKGRDVVAAIKNMISRTADTIKRYGKPSKNFTWADSIYSRGPKGLNAKLATAALRKARGLEENKQLTETRPRHGLDPREFGRKVIHLRDGTSGIVVAVTRDIILLKSGERIIPSQVDWRKTNEGIIRESSEFAATAAEEAAKVNRDLGDAPGRIGSLPEDQAYWDKYDIITGEDLAIDLVAGTYSDMYKAVHGIRPRHGFSSYKEVCAALTDLERYAEDKAAEDEFYAEQEAEYNKARDELAALMPTACELQYDKMPSHSGMGRRHEGMEKRMLRTTRKRLKRIIEQVSQEINEMPVTKSHGWGMDKYEEKYPHLVSFADEIDALMEDWGYTANVKMFDSGYSGISIEFADAQGAKQKWLVVDQPGKVGLEDQSMGYIYFGPGGKGIQESNAWIWEQVPYLGRRFGDTNMRDEARAQTYDAILDTMDSMLEDPHEMHLGEADTKKYDDDSALKGGQSKLPDELQKGIIDKTVKDREEDEEKNEGFRILNKMIMKEMSDPDPLDALAAAQEMGYSLEQPPQLDSNNIAIDDALAAYPGEFTYEDIIAAVKASGGTV